MTEIKVPPLGESIVEATVSRWHKNEGDQVASGDTLVELDTDKITVEVPAVTAGVLAKRLRAEGDVVHVGDPLCEVEEAAAGAAGRPPAKAEKPALTETAVPPPTPAAASAQQMPTAQPAPEAVRVSPAAQRVAAERGIDAGTIKGTGLGGVVSKADIVEQTQPDGRTNAKPAGETPGAPPPPPADRSPALSRASEREPSPAAERIPSPPPAAPARPAADSGQRETREKMSTRRKRIAEHLVEAQHVTAHLTTFNEIDMSAVSALRDRWRERVEKEHAVKLTFMPFFVKAACLALKSVPVVNAQIDGDAFVYKHYVNMGIAVASDAGLVVPNVKDADRKGLIEVAQEIAAVAKRARDGKLTMEDLTGGTFTITNGGVFGSLVSTPILNYPQSGILGLHKIQDRPVVIDGQVVIRPMMYVALSYDHRIIDGQQAVLFLVRVKSLMEDPASMLIE